MFSVEMIFEISEKLFFLYSHEAHKVSFLEILRFS